MSPASMVHIVLAAMPSAALTWLLGYGVYERRLASGMQRMLGQIRAEFETRVKAGVLAAGEELLPALREQVKPGFQDALRETEAGSGDLRGAGARRALNSATAAQYLGLPTGPRLNCRSRPSSS